MILVDNIEQIDRISYLLIRANRTPFCSSFLFGVIKSSESMKEIFKDIKGYEGLYQVSNLGNIKSFHFGSKILKPGIDVCGYTHVALCKNNTLKLMTVHRIVAIAFIPNPYEFPCINHKDHNKQNNNVSNLEWCTYKYNSQYTLTHKGAFRKYGCEQPKNKLNIFQVQQIFTLHNKGYSNRKIGKIIGVSCTMVFRILNFLD